MHSHSSARVERVRPDVFWGKSESSCAHLTGPSPEDCDDVQGADGSESLDGARIVSDKGGGRSSMLPHVE